ncbi:MAG: hypothetical protein AAFQ44_00090, partial [Pseudomonadota bacterium]
MRCFAAVTALLAGGVAAATLFSTQAQSSEPLPGWKVREICREDSSIGQCRLFEIRAQRALLQSWAFILDEHKAACLARFQPPLEPSYRILGECVENEVRLEKERHIASIRKREEA